jgi:hypothetical protein
MKFSILWIGALLLINLLRVESLFEPQKCGAYELSGRMSEIRPRVKSMIYPKENVFGFATVEMSSIPLQDLIIMSHERDLLVQVSSKETKNQLRELCRKVRHRLVFFFSKEDQIEDSLFPGNIDSIRVSASSMFESRFQRQTRVAMIGFESYLAAYGKVDVDLDQFSGFIDFSPINKNHLHVSLPKTFIMIGELEEDLMYSKERSFPYTKENGKEMSMIESSGYRMNLFGECDRTDLNKYNFLFNFRDSRFILRSVQFEGITCSEAFVKRKRMLKILEDFDFEGGNSWKKLNSKRLIASDFDLMESYLKSNFGYVLISPTQSTLFRSPVYWISKKAEDKARPSCWNKCFYLEHSGEEESTKGKCLEKDDYFEYKDLDLVVKPVSACDTPDFKARIHPEMMIKYTGDLKSKLYTGNLKDSYGEVSDLELRHGETKIPLYFQTKTNQFFKFMSSGTCENIKPGHPIFFKERLVGFVNDATDHPGFCLLRFQGLKIS